MPNITFSQEIMLCIWKEGELVSVERKNGHLERYMVQPASWGDTTNLFGVDLPAKN